MSVLAALCSSLALASLISIGGPLQEKPSAASAEWQQILDELTPKLVAHRKAPPEERKKESFTAERARLQDFFRRYEKSEPELAWSARVWLATNVLRDALEQERDAADELVTIAKDSASGDAATLAAVQAGDGLLKLGDEAGLERLRAIYAARADRNRPVADHLADLCRQVRVRPGRPFPELALTDLSGKAIDWKALRGQVVLVVVFNVESDPSREALARAAGLAKLHAGDGLAVVGISLDVDRARLVAELERLKANFPVDFTGKEWKAPAAKELGLSQIPALFLLDPKGTILEARRGPMAEGFDAIVERSLRAAREGKGTQSH
jgi:peroxiredoxin